MNYFDNHASGTLLQRLQNKRQNIENLKQFTFFLIVFSRPSGGHEVGSLPATAYIFRAKTSQTLLFSAPH